ncbi:MAG TPA: sensor histidine kinase, partial [Candidatus Paceibacterota bacterium]
SFKADAAKKNVIIVFDKISMPAEAISLDVGRIRSVLNILIRNALNYTPSGGQIVIKLKKEIENDKEVFHLIIQDNGVGIRREDLNKIFSRFYRSPDVIKIIPDGAGLGLFIAKHIIEAHNGRLWAESDGIGKGSSFHVILPKTI